MGEGELAGGSGWGEGGARETGREAGGDEDRKPDTVCVIKLGARSLVHGVGCAPPGLQHRGIPCEEAHTTCAC